MVPPLVAYLSHSYRPEDRAVNIAVWQRLNAAGLVFAVDPPDFKSPMDVTFLERMMQRADCFVAIVPNRAAAAGPDETGEPDGAAPVRDRTWSPYQALEVRLALRADKPRLVMVERAMGWGPLPADEQVLSFDRASLAMQGDFDTALATLRRRAQARATLAGGPLPKVGLLRWDPCPAAWQALLDQVKARFDVNDWDYLEVAAGTADQAVLARARRFSVVVVDLNPELTPAYLVGMLHGAAVPLYRTCLVADDGADRKAWLQRLSLEAPAVGAPAAERSAPGLLHGFQVPDDKRMAPVQFWCADQAREAGRKAGVTIAGYQRRERQLSEKSVARDYFLGLRGNRVFISTPGDLEDFSVYVKQQLDDAGMPAFHYKRSAMDSGLNWGPQLRDRINDHDLLLGLLSPTYWSRPECVDELAEAVRRWERHQMLIVLYRDPALAEPQLPAFLGRMQANPIGDAVQTGERIVEELRQRFGDKAREPFTAEIEGLTRLLQHHAPVANVAQLTAWLIDAGALSAVDAARVVARLDGVSDRTQKLVRVLLGAIHEEPFGAGPLGRIGLWLRARENDAPGRAWIDTLFSKLRLFPNLHDVQGWVERRARRTVTLRLQDGAPAKLIELAATAAGKTPEPMQWVQRVGPELATYLQADDNRLLSEDARAQVAIDCRPDDLAVPVEWAVLPALQQPLARVRGAYRRVSPLGAVPAPRCTLEAHHHRSAGGPPRVLLFGHGGARLPHVDAELTMLEQLFINQWNGLQWPADRLVRCVGGAQATIGVLRTEVERSDVAVLHLAGHAGVHNGQPVLQLATDGGGDDGDGLIAADRLADWLRDSSVRFVYLSCCEGAASSAERDAVTAWRQSLCRSLLDAGVPEVLAFLWPIGDTDALGFTRTFYDSFVPRFDAVGALAAARRRCTLDQPLWAASLLARRADADRL